MKILYFASVRERIGKAEEEVAPPAQVVTVADLMRWLGEKDESYAAAFENMASMRAALDHAHVRHETNIADAREIAFFPPMTGG